MILIFLSVLFCKDFSKGFFIITDKDKKRTMTTSNSGSVRGLDQKKPTKNTDLHVIRFEKTGDLYYVKFVATGKYLCESFGEKYLKTCDKGEPLLKLKITKDNGFFKLSKGNMCLTSLKKSLKKPKGKAWRMLKCGEKPHKQKLIVEEVLSKKSSEKNKPDEKENLNKPYAKEILNKPDEKENINKPGTAISKNKGIEGINGQNISNLGDIKKNDKKSGENKALFSKDNYDDTSDLKKPDFKILGEDKNLNMNNEKDDDSSSSDEEKNKTDSSNINKKIKMVSKCMQGCSLNNSLIKQPCMSNVPTEQILIDENGIEKVSSNINGLQKAITEVNNLGSNDITLPTDGKTTRIIRIV